MKIAPTARVIDRFVYDINGIATATLDASLAGITIPGAITVVASLDHPTKPQIRFDGIQTYLDGLTDLSQLSFGQIVSGTRAILNTVESGLKSDLLEQLPLIGDGVDLNNSFIGKLNGMLDELDALFAASDSATDAIKVEVQQRIFAALGPAGANILNLNATYDDDPVVPNAIETADYRDVPVHLDDPLITPAAELEMRIDLPIAGRDVLDVDFDLGVDALVMEFETTGGVELEFDYAFNLGFGVSLQKGFFFQLNDEVTYASTAARHPARRRSRSVRR
ncbi:MAG: hypothetical protein R3C05_14595 [Pirellulaceae bacterium]